VTSYQQIAVQRQLEKIPPSKPIEPVRKAKLTSLILATVLFPVPMSHSKSNQWHINVMFN
jgi:hypothetical protein